MTHAREWRSSLTTTLLMVILLSSLLHFFCVYSRVGAIRVSPETPAPVKKHEDLMKKYFGAGKLPPVDSLVGKGISDSKRMVPSCPDPLHN
ncbi:PREDICTED: CLAVATA3/ESR (CLE)-related protein 27-like [Camelina sativa]|uniref:CLAVATA3/ESR (CLE)-related protein 27-like n=1 Tax=Camelina sativa TaxID=90675 RepID=A0ABM1RLE4_CAMSA|nr:PREDICTED: CLAVATA3/ESR (CLE)-related protein 27-like [Camelina sativa]